MPWRDHIGSRIRESRGSLTQEQLAEATDVTSLTISKFETGRAFPKVETVERIAAATGYPAFWFFMTDEQAALFRDYGVGNLAGYLVAVAHETAEKREASSPPSAPLHTAAREDDLEARMARMERTIGRLVDAVEQLAAAQEGEERCHEARGRGRKAAG